MPEVVAATFVPSVSNVFFFISNYNLISPCSSSIRHATCERTASSVLITTEVRKQVILFTDKILDVFCFSTFKRIMREGFSKNNQGKHTYLFRGIETNLNFTSTFTTPLEFVIEKKKLESEGRSDVPGK